MKLLYLLYVSRSTIAIAETEVVFAEIVETAHRVNLETGLTGALIFCGSTFAQVLEGPADAVDTMMASIGADPRHTDVFVAARAPTSYRRFKQWRMAYFGRIAFVERHITDLLELPEDSDPSRSATRLIDLIYGLSVR